MDFPFFASPNFTCGRKRKIKAIIIHRATGNLKKTVKRCFDLSSRESFHFIISQKGKTIQLVKCKDTAWHCGWITNPEVPDFLKPNPNFCSIGIALEDKEGKNRSCWTKEQKESLLKLLSFLEESLEIEIIPQFVMGHSQIDPRRNPVDPGSFIAWEEIFKAGTYLGKKGDINKSKENSEERQREVAQKLFRGILGRDPDAWELDYLKHSNLDIAQISRKLIGTEEFKNKILKSRSKITK